MLMPHRRARRRAWVVAVATGVAAPLALQSAPAAAQGPFNATLGGSVSPVIRGFPESPQALSMKIDLAFDTNPPGGTPPTVGRAVLSFPYGARLNSRRFPSCTAARLKGGPGRCPSGSRLGTGSVTAVVNNQQVPVQLDLVNGPRGRSILFLFRASTPVNIAEVVQAPLQTISDARYRYRLTLAVPQVLQQPVAGLTVGVRRFTATLQRKRIRVRGERIGFIEALACPPGARIPLRGDFTYVNGGNQSVDSFLTCGG
jgi:hypothetical protein